MHNYDNTMIGVLVENARDNFGIVEPDKATALIHELSPKDWARAAQMYPKDASKPDDFYIDAHGGDITIHNDLAGAKQVVGESDFKVAFDASKQDAERAFLALTFGLPTMAGFGAALGYMDGTGALMWAGIGGLGTVGLAAAFSAVDYGVHLWNTDETRQNAAKLAQQPADLTLHSA
jgi:hypothetical protein